MTLPTPFARPEGATIDPAGLALHQLVMAWRRAHKTDYVAALDAVTRLIARTRAPANTTGV